MTYWELYWLTRLQDLKCAIGVLSLLLLLSGIAASFLYTTNCDSYSEEGKIFARRSFKYTKISLFLSLFCFVVQTFIPNTKDLALIYSGHFATHSEEMKKLPDNLLRYLNTFLEEKKESK
jgi:hypothetical protein